jgi:DNA-binding Lrp family transcriptional regulator
MVVPFTPDSFHDGAREFAQTALEAHHARKYRRVAIDAGTALEYLAKACLAARSPALLMELKSEANFPHLLELLGISEGLGISGGKARRRLRTVSLRGALERAKTLVTSRASDEDLRALIDMRDGSIHAAQSDEVEERLLVAFVQQADAFLADLGFPRPLFWDAQLAVVDALLADASDKVAHRVEVKLAEARANFQRQYGTAHAEVLDLVRRLATPQRFDEFEFPGPVDCPACASLGVASGFFDIEWDEERDEDRVPMHGGTLLFFADGLRCRVCGLELGSAAELAATGMEPPWEEGHVDRSEYDSEYEQALDEGAEYGGPSGQDPEEDE